MMGPSQCYIPSHKVIGPLVPEKKIFEGFLPYMGMSAILVMWPRPREQTFVPPSHWGSIWNLALISPAVLEKKIFEKCGRTDDEQTTDHGYTISSPNWWAYSIAMVRRPWGLRWTKNVYLKLTSFIRYISIPSKYRWAVKLVYNVLWSLYMYIYACQQFP